MATMLSPFFGLDILAIARWQYGAKATLHPYPEHAYGWAAKLPNSNQRYWLDIAGWVRARHGENTRLVLRGMGGSDWVGFMPYETDYAVLPVILVASDHIWDVGGVRWAVECYRHNVAYVADWYAGQMGKSFPVIEPIVVHSSKTTAEWKAVYDDHTDRFDLYKACEAEIIKAFGGKINERLIYCVTQYTGNTPAWDWDAAGGRFAGVPGFQAVVSGFAACQKFIPGSMSLTDDAIAYALAHELGHCFDLRHTDPAAPGFDRNTCLMARGFPPNAKFLDYEIQHLNKNPFFKR